MEAKQSKVVELGCGGRVFPGAIGVDEVLAPATAAQVKCRLGFERLDFSDDMFDIALARHLLEHIPDRVFLEEETLSPSIVFFNEAWRVLTDGGVLYIEVPLVPTIQSFQDPQHCSFWNLEKLNYFSGDYYGFHDVYGHFSRFWKKKVWVHQGWLGRALFQAIKHVPSDYPYNLDYAQDGSRNLDLDSLERKYSIVCDTLVKEGVF